MNKLFLITARNKSTALVRCQKGKVVLDLFAFGDSLKRARESVSITQSQIAKSLGVSPQTVSNLELGKCKIDLDNYTKVCSAYGLDVNIPLDILHESLNESKVSAMMYELSQEEIDHIEKYRDLTDEYKEAADKNLQTLFELQTRVFRELLGQ